RSPCPQIAVAVANHAPNKIAVETIGVHRVVTKNQKIFGFGLIKIESTAFRTQPDAILLIAHDRPHKVVTQTGWVSTVFREVPKSTAGGVEEVNTSGPGSNPNSA